MSPQSTLNKSRALEGIHGVHLVPHSAFTVEEINQHESFHQSTCQTSVVGASQLLILQRVWQQRPSCLRPIRCSLHGDRNLGETIVNVLTSLPFVAIGIQTPRKNLNCKIYANSLIGVGVASSLYHVSRGSLRKYTRWADYTMIATATVCLSRALRDENSKLLMAVSALALPIQPLMVSAVHTGMMEVFERAFYKQQCTYARKCEMCCKTVVDICFHLSSWANSSRKISIMAWRTGLFSYLFCIRYPQSSL